MNESVLRPPTDRDVGAIADWIEATMAIEERTLFAKALIRKRLAADGHDDEAGLSLALAEIRRRAKVAGSLYPFEAGSAGVRRHGRASRAYDFLLTCSLQDAPFRQTRDWGAVVRLFEQLAVAGLQTIFGPGTKALRFGHPPEMGRPSNFNEALEWLAAQLHHSVGPGKVSSNEQDGGVDAIAWRPFADERVGFPVLLAQCTLQREYESKGSDIILNRWRSWVLLRRDPLSALVVPFALGQSAEAWEEANCTVDVVIDRFRLCELLGPVDLSTWQHHRHLLGWLDRELGELRLAM